MAKYIFLDVDCVLNNYTTTVQGGHQHPKQPIYMGMDPLNVNIFTNP